MADKATQSLVDPYQSSQAMVLPSRVDPLVSEPRTLQEGFVAFLQTLQAKTVIPRRSVSMPTFPSTEVRHRNLLGFGSVV
jgi:hypothetical protein